MARYIYSCSRCQRSFEVEKNMSRSGQAEPCPSCGQMGERVYTAPALTRSGAEAAFTDTGGDHEGECSNCAHADECGLD